MSLCFSISDKYIGKFYTFSLSNFRGSSNDNLSRSSTHLSKVSSSNLCFCNISLESISNICFYFLSFILAGCLNFVSFSFTSCLKLFEFICKGADRSFAIKDFINLFFDVICFVFTNLFENCGKSNSFFLSN